MHSRPGAGGEGEGGSAAGVTQSHDGYFPGDLLRNISQEVIGDFGAGFVAGSKEEHEQQAS